MKMCKTCLVLIDESLFYKKSNSCKKCDIERVKKYISENKESVSKKRKERYLNNRDSELQKKKDYDNKNRDLVRERARNRYDKEKASEYYLRNKDVILKRNKSWIDNNSEKFKKVNVLNTIKWLKKNPHVVVWRQMIYRTLKTFGKEKDGKSIDLLGYTSIELRSHIESLFIDGMCWENWGEWHIDHIIPLSKFDKETPINIVNSLSNLQPLWAIDNLRKGNS